MPKFTISEEEDTSGYDSNGALGPFYDILDTEGYQDFDEDSRPSIEPVVIDDDDNDEEDVAIAVEDHPRHIPIEDAIMKKLKVSELQEELKKRRKATGGLKAVLLT